MDEIYVSGAADVAESKLSAAERARIERNRLKARELLQSRLVQKGPNTAVVHDRESRLLDTGGGFLLEQHEACAPPPVRHPPAPLAHPAECCPCEECGRPVATSYLLDTFACAVCDECRDEDGEHALITRTEAKAEFLLRDCDLDAREPPLRCVRRPNPHRGGADMRLYLRAQLRRQALLVWGSEAELQQERERRADKAQRAKGTRAARRLRELRLHVRSTLYAKPASASAHRHCWAEETYDASSEEYSRRCTECGHTETYEKL